MSGGEGELSMPSSPPLSSVGLDIASVEGSKAEAASSGGLLVAARERRVDEPFLVSTSGTPSFSLPSLFHLFTRQLNVSGIDWVEGLKKLSLNSIEIRSPISATIVEEPPIGSVLEPVLHDSVHSPIESSDSSYFLRSCTKGGSGGLGRNPAASARGRGRVSLLAKAQSRAKKDVLEGKQILIDRALRAVNACKKDRR